MLAKLQLTRCKFSAAKKFFPTFRGGGFWTRKPPPLKYGPGLICHLRIFCNSPRACRIVTALVLFYCTWNRTFRAWTISMHRCYEIYSKWTECCWAFIIGKCTLLKLCYFKVYYFVISLECQPFKLLLLLYLMACYSYWWRVFIITLLLIWYIFLFYI